MSGPEVPMVGRLRGPTLGRWGDQDVAVGVGARLTSEPVRAGLGAGCAICPGLGHGGMRASRLGSDRAGCEAACDARTRTPDLSRWHLVRR